MSEQNHRKWCPLNHSPWKGASCCCGYLAMALQDQRDELTKVLEKEAAALDRAARDSAKLGEQTQIVYHTESRTVRRCAALIRNKEL